MLLLASIERFHCKRVLISLAGSTFILPKL